MVIGTRFLYAYRKFTKHAHNGSPEILRLGHSIPLAGHMELEKTLEKNLCITSGLIYTGK